MEEFSARDFGCVHPATQYRVLIGRRCVRRIFVGRVSKYALATCANAHVSLLNHWPLCVSHIDRPSGSCQPGRLTRSLRVAITGP
jgi:hypothetical protein